MKSLWGKIAATWGVVGVTLLVSSAIFRLSPYVVDALTAHQLSLGQWVLLIAFSIFMLFSEGYRGFQKKFSPRVVARARYLSTEPTLLRTIFAPLFCMGFFHATKKRLITSYAVTSAIICMIILVRQLPQPWRGIIDTGVILGLGWGVAAIFAFVFLWLSGKPFPYSPETPDQP